MNINNLVNHIKAIRTVRGMDQGVLAKDLGISVRALSNIEDGCMVPSVGLMVRICEYFDLPLEGVFYLKPKIEMSEKKFVNI